VLSRAGVVTVDLAVSSNPMSAKVPDAAIRAAIRSAREVSDGTLLVITRAAQASARALRRHQRAAARGRHEAVAFIEHLTILSVPAGRPQGGHPACRQDRASAADNL
jgi:hypothetical protein